MFDRAISKRKRELIIRLACYALVIAGAFLAGDAAVPALNAVDSSGILRLHIIANSDSSYDQQVKLAVRDAVLTEHSDTFAECGSLDEAISSARNILTEIVETARVAAADAGFYGDVRASVGMFEFPDKVYGETIVPAGSYPALRIELGAASGHNWWCIMYPGMCAPTAAVPAVSSSEMDNAPKAQGGITFHSAILDCLRNIFS